MRLYELIEKLSEIRKISHEEVEVLVYCDDIQDFIPLDSVELLPADEYGSHPASVRFS